MSTISKPSAQPAAEQKYTPPIKWGTIVSYILLGIFTVVYLGPLLMLVITSMKTMPEFMRNATALPSALNFENFVEAWDKANFPRYMTNTILYTGAATIIYCVTAVFVAFPIARGYVKGANFFLTLYVIALFLPVALIPQFQLMLALGLRDLAREPQARPRDLRQVPRRQGSGLAQRPQH